MRHDEQVGGADPVDVRNRHDGSRNTDPCQRRLFAIPAKVFAGRDTPEQLKAPEADSAHQVSAMALSVVRECLRRSTNQ